MAQMGFFDLSDRYASLDAKKDPLVEIDAVVPWEFRPALELGPDTTKLAALPHCGHFPRLQMPRHLRRQGTYSSSSCTQHHTSSWG